MLRKVAESVVVARSTADEAALSPAPPLRPVAALPRKVLIYAINYKPELIGCGRYTGEIGDYLARRGTAVEVVTAPPHYPGWAVKLGYRSHRYMVEQVDGVRVTRCPIGLSQNMRGFGRIWAPLSFAISSAPAVFWRILRFRPSHVLCVEPTLLGTPAALLAARLVGAKTILHVQDLEIDAAFAVGHVKAGAIKPLMFGLEQMALKLFDRVVTISGKMREKLAQKGVDDSRLAIVRNWVDASQIYPLTGPNPFRTECDISADATVALYAGNIGVKQALHLVMDAAEKLRERHDIVFVIAGEGPEKKAMQDRRLPNVKFLPLQPEHRLNELLNLADVHLLPQDKGAADLVLPSKIGGMLASGKPIVAMADAGTEVHEFLGDAADFISPADVDGLARALVRRADTRGQDAVVRRDKLAQLDKDNIAAIFEVAAPV